MYRETFPCYIILSSHDKIHDTQGNGFPVLISTSISVVQGLDLLV
jgi:hypothetical protein